MILQKFSSFWLLVIKTLFYLVGKVRLVTHRAAAWFTVALRNDPPCGGQVFSSSAFISATSPPCSLAPSALSRNRTDSLRYQASATQQNRTALVATEAGFEPANTGIKTLCLTSWLLRIVTPLEKLRRCSFVPFNAPNSIRWVLVRRGGYDPPHSEERKILSLVRLPIPPSSHVATA